MTINFLLTGSKALKLMFSIDPPARGYRSRTNSSSGIGETDFVLLQSSPVGHMHWQPVSISISGYSESVSDHSSRCSSQPPSPSKFYSRNYQSRRTNIVFVKSFPLMSIEVAKLHEIVFETWSREWWHIIFIRSVEKGHMNNNWYFNFKYVIVDCVWGMYHNNNSRMTNIWSYYSFSDKFCIQLLNFILINMGISADVVSDLLNPNFINVIFFSSPLFPFNFLLS